MSYKNKLILEFLLFEKMKDAANKQAFTLVELIVVITILAILGTIAFISLQGYSANSRDSVRISDTQNIKTVLELFHLDSGKYPLPDNYSTAQYSGDNLYYQGTFGQTVQKNVSRNINKIPTDPLTNIEYTYSVSVNKNELEILSLMEGDDFTLNTISEINAAGVTVIPRITGNYNGLFVKTITHIVPLPSIINTEASSGTLLILNSNNVKSMITNKGKNIPNQGNVITSTGNLTNFVLTGALNNLTKDSTDAQKAAVINTIKSAYVNESQLNTDGIIQYITNLATDNTTFSSVFNTMILNDGALLYNSTGINNKTSFYSENINHKFNEIEGVPLANGYYPYGGIISGNYIYYSNASDGHKLYKLNKDGSSNIKISDDYVYGLVSDGLYIYYTIQTGDSTNQYIYRIKNDGTGRSLVSTVRSFLKYVDNNFLYLYPDNNIYRMNKDGTNSSAYIVTKVFGGGLYIDDNYVYFDNRIDNANLRTYKKDKLTGIESLVGNFALSYNSLSVDNNYFYYIYNGLLGRVNKDGTNLNNNILNTNFIGWNGVSFDNNYIYYFDKNGYPYMVDKNLTTPVKLSFGKVKLDNNGIVLSDSENIYYSNNLKGNIFYKVNISNPQGFLKSDSLYTSSKITTIDNNDNIYINVGTTLPTGTSYIFELANSNIEQIKMPESDVNVFVFSNKYDYYGSAYNLISMFSIGDTVKLFKSGQTDITATISTISSYGITFTAPVGITGDGWGIKVSSTNYKVITNDKLDGNTLINLASEFGSTTTDLYYRITLNTTDNTLTPIINSVDFSK